MRKGDAGTMAPGLDQENEFQESFPTSLGGAVPRALTAGIASAEISSRSLCPDPLDLQWAAQARGFRGAQRIALPSHLLGREVRVRPKDPLGLVSGGFRARGCILRRSKSITEGQVEVQVGQTEGHPRATRCGKVLVAALGPAGLDPIQAPLYALVTYEP